MITYDYTNMLSNAVGKFGASKKDIKEIKTKIETIHRTLVKEYGSGDLGFAHLPEEKKMVKVVQQTAKKLDGKFKNIIIVGIGGSDLGARALIRAFRIEIPQKEEARINVFFLGATTDPEEIEEVLGQIDLKETAINIISKSGGTIEPMSVFLYLREQLKKEVGDTFAEHIIATTDPEKGILRELALKEGYATLPVPQNVGGRYSVLSAVGLFPAECAGINIKKLLKGARDMNKKIITVKKLEKNDTMMFAALQYLAYIKRNQKISVIVPYAAMLDKMGAWYRQLWAESLGNAKDLEGNTVYHGATPVAALGPTDQHSQLQLWNEGPYDKTITLVKVNTFREKIRVPKNLSVIPPFQYIENTSFEKIMHTELESTAQSLTENKRPNGTLILPEISESSIGAYFMFFEWAAVFMGALLNVNAFDQPGVERSKVLIKEKLA